MLGGKNNASRRLSLLGDTLSWDKKATEQRRAVQKYKDSNEETHNRLGNNLPGSRNGSNRGRRGRR